MLGGGLEGLERKVRGGGKRDGAREHSEFRVREGVRGKRLLAHAIELIAYLFLENATVRGRVWYKLLEASVISLDVTA